MRPPEARPLNFLNPSTIHSNLPRIIFAFGTELNEYKIKKQIRYFLHVFQQNTTDRFLVLLDANPATSQFSPGIQLLYTKNQPWIRKVALLSSTHIFTTQLDVLKFATSHDIPATLLSEYFPLSFSKSLALIQNAQRRPNGTSSIRIQKKLLQSNAIKKMQLCTIIDHDYLPMFLGLIENVRVFCRDNFIVHVLALDSKTVKTVRSLYPKDQVHVLTLKDICQTQELSSLKARAKRDWVFSLKPRLLLKVLKLSQQPFLYSDVDVFFFTNPLSLLPEKNSQGLTLFPHWHKSIENNRHHGIFNAGLIAIGRNGKAPLQWWTEQCKQSCTQSSRSHYYYDQGYLDLLPVYFSNVQVDRSKAHNVACWNTHAVKSKANVRSFHASSPDKLGLFETKFLWDQIVTFFSPLENVNQFPLLHKNSLLQQARHSETANHIVWLSQAIENKVGLQHLLENAKFSSWMSHTYPQTVVKLVRKLKANIRRDKGAPKQSSIYQNGDCLQ